MPATSPRLCITMPEETRRAFQRLATAQRRPLGAVIREILEASTPAVSDLAGTMEALRAAQASAKAEVVQHLVEAHDELLPHFKGIVGHLQALTELASDPGSGVPDAAPFRGGDRRSGPRQPPACNTGVVNG